MEYTLNELKKKTVINIKDGKKIGKIQDVTIGYPNFKIVDFIVSPSKVNIFCSDLVKVRPCDIENIGEDAILVKFVLSPKERCEEMCNKVCSENICDCEE